MYRQIRKREQAAIYELQSFIKRMVYEENSYKRKENKIEYFSLMCNLRSSMAQRKSRRLEYECKGNIEYLLLAPSILSRNPERKREMITILYEYGILNELIEIYMRSFKSKLDDNVVRYFLEEIMEESNEIFFQLCIQIYNLCSAETKLIMEKCVKDRALPTMTIAICD